MPPTGSQWYPGAGHLGKLPVGPKGLFQAHCTNARPLTPGRSHNQKHRDGSSEAPIGRLLDSEANLMVPESFVHAQDEVTQTTAQWCVPNFPPHIGHPGNPPLGTCAGCLVLCWRQAARCRGRPPSLPALPPGGAASELLCLRLHT